MLYPIHPGDVRQDYEARVAEWRSKLPPPAQEYAVGLDFADFDQQRYAMVTRRQPAQLSAPHRRLWERIRTWGARRWTRPIA